ncbi:MAG: hypothetical protein ACRC8S_19390 [Fimbriiglobus sp.]
MFSTFFIIIFSSEFLIYMNENKPTPNPWYRISVRPHGDPCVAPFAVGMSVDELRRTYSPAQLRSFSLVSMVHYESDILELDQAVSRSISGLIPTEDNNHYEGWSNGGGAGIAIYSYASDMIEFGNQYDGMDKLYPDDSVFRMPTVDFLPLWEDWKLSMRQYNELLEQHGIIDARGQRVLPKQFHPKSYPIRTQG